MKIRGNSFSVGAGGVYLVLIMTVLIQLGFLFYYSWHWHNITVDGIPYQWRCVLRLEMSAFGTDYIRVIFPEDTTVWNDTALPVKGQEIYVAIGQDTRGIMEVRGASASPPADRSDYMKAKVVAVDEEARSVQFKVGFDRYRVAPEYRDGIYDISAGDSVIANVRLKKGDGVIDGIYINGISLEASSTGAALQGMPRDDAKGTAPKIRIVESTMVPPKEE